MEQHPYTDDDIRDLVASGHWPAPETAETEAEEADGGDQAGGDQAGEDQPDTTMAPAEPQPTL